MATFAPSRLVPAGAFFPICRCCQSWAIVVDIRSLFRDLDINAMKRRFDLSKYQDVHDNADKILISDIRQFCERQPGACTAGSQAIVQFGHKAETGAKWLYQFLNERKATDQLPVTTKGADKSSTGRPSSSTLTPTDLAAPWHGPQRRGEAEPRRPS